MGHAFFIVCLKFILFRCSFGFSVLFFYLVGFGDFNSFQTFQSDFVEAFWLFRISVLRGFLIFPFPSAQNYFWFLSVRFVIYVC